MKAIQAATASSSGTATTEVEAMFSRGSTPVMFIAKIAKNIVVSKGMNGRALALPMTSSAMLTRTKSSAISATFCARPGTRVALRATSQKESASTTAAIIRTRVIRLNSKIVPSNPRAGGKNSETDGMWKPPPSSPDAASRRFVAAVIRAHSPRSCGRPRREEA